MNLSQIFARCKLIFCLALLLAFKAPDLKAEQYFIRSDKLHYDQRSNYIEATNNNDITTQHYLFNSSDVLYDLTFNQLWLKNVTIYDNNQRILNSEAAFYDANKQYMVMNKIAADLGNNSILVARKAVSFNNKYLELDDTSFTPCKMCNSKQPIWSISAQKTILDEDKQQITYNHAKFKIYGVPVFYTPYFSHPRPNAPARSGFLIPNIRNHSFNTPYYWRIAPNFDATLQPRFTTDAIVYQGQIRHLMPQGNYELNASYGRVPLSKTSTSQHSIVKKNKHSSFYIFGNADFIQHDIKYGAQIDIVSDKAFLKKYYSKYDSFLTSKLFLERNKHDEYLNIEALYFQNLFDDSQELGKHSLAAPEIHYKKFWNPLDSNSNLLILDNQFTNYHAREKIDLLKNSISISWKNKQILPYGFIFTSTAYNKIDLYLRHLNTAKHNSYSPALSRTIPELHFDIRNNFFTPDAKLLLEPRVMLIIGKKNGKNYNKFRTIGHEYFEITDSNLFSNNRSALSDFHDYGTRANYGVTAYLPGNSISIQTFLGETHYVDMPNKKYRNQLVGNTSITFPYNFSLTHKFSKLRSEFSSLRDEIGAGRSGKILDWSVSYFEQRPMQNIFEEYSLSKIKQGNILTTLHITPNIDLSNDFRVDFAKDNKAKLLLHTIKVTYIMDCVSMHAKLTNDRMIDKARGIRKSHDVAFTVGLKTINM